MSQVSALQSLDLILEDVSAEINLSINSLEHYANSQEKSKAIGKCLSHLKKLKGVFTLLEMQGAQCLITEVVSVLQNLHKQNKSLRTHLLEVTSTALARLMRYIEHVNQKPDDLPQLLIPTINTIRSAANSPPLGESAFFNCDCNTRRADKELVLVTSEETAAISRHYRQMYQIGLIEVLRQTNLPGGLRMMQKAMQKLDDECPRPGSPNLWWIAQAMLDAYIDNKLFLTKPRLKLFSRLDSQIRKIENKGEDLINNNNLEMELLAREMLYLTWISQVNTERARILLKHFSLGEAPVSDERLRKESEELRGPSDQDYHSIAEALSEEIKSIEKILTVGQANDFATEDLKQAMEQMINLRNLLKILQVDDQIVRLNVAIDLIKVAISENKKLSEKDANILFIVLKDISEAVEQSELSKYSGKRSVRKETLTKTQRDICKRTYTQVKQLIRQFIEFTDNNRNVILLKNSDQLLDDIQKGFIKLKVESATSIIDGCKVFLNEHLIKNPHTAGQEAINLFADIISGLEFYLETLEFTAKPSPKILEFSKNSLLWLNQQSNKQ